MHPTKLSYAPAKNTTGGIDDESIEIKDSSDAIEFTSPYENNIILNNKNTTDGIDDESIEIKNSSDAIESTPPHKNSIHISLNDKNAKESVNDEFKKNRWCLRSWAAEILSSKAKWLKTWG